MQMQSKEPIQPRGQPIRNEPEKVKPPVGGFQPIMKSYPDKPEPEEKMGVVEKVGKATGWAILYGLVGALGALMTAPVGGPLLVPALAAGGTAALSTGVSTYQSYYGRGLKPHPRNHKLVYC